MNLNLEISAVRRLRTWKQTSLLYSPLLTELDWHLNNMASAINTSFLFLMTLKHSSASHYIQSAIKTDRSLNSATKEWKDCHAHGPNEYCWQAVQVPTSKMWNFIRGFLLLENSQMLGYFVNSQLVCCWELWRRCVTWVWFQFFLKTLAVKCWVILWTAQLTKAQRIGQFDRFTWEPEIFYFKKKKSLVSWWIGLAELLILVEPVRLPNPVLIWPQWVKLFASFYQDISSCLLLIFVC